jgi:hypothetical protein
MLYTVAEVSDMLEFSKVTIYNKINSLKTDLKPYIKHRKGITYIDDKGVLIIKRDLGLIEDENTLNSGNEFKAENPLGKSDLKQFKEINILVETLEKTIKTGQANYINSLLGQIELLKSELNKKDEQINNTLRLLENSQVLIKDNKEKILMLESKEEKEKKGFLNWLRK